MATIRQPATTQATNYNKYQKKQRPYRCDRALDCTGPVHP